MNKAYSSWNQMSCSGQSYNGVCVTLIIVRTWFEICLLTASLNIWKTRNLKLITECHPIYVDSSYFFEKQKLEIFSVYWKFWSSASIELIDFYKNYEEYFVFCERIDMMMMMKKWCQQLNILRTLAFILSSILEAHVR